MRYAKKTKAPKRTTRSFVQRPPAGAKAHEAGKGLERPMVALDSVPRVTTAATVAAVELGETVKHLALWAAGHRPRFNTKGEIINSIVFVRNQVAAMQELAIANNYNVLVDEPVERPRRTGGT